MNVYINYRRKGNKKFLYFTWDFINYYCITDSCIYCYPIRCKVKRNHLLPFYVTNNELK